MTNGSEIIDRVSQASTDSAKLGELRAKRRALESAREARAVERASTDAIAAEERAIADEEAIAAAETEHGEVDKKIRIVRTPAGTVIVKRPNNVLFRKFADQGKSDVDDLERLARPCIVYPTIDQFDRMLTDQPAILIDVANAVTYLAGVRTKEHAAK